MFLYNFFRYKKPKENKPPVETKVEQQTSPFRFPGSDGDITKISAIEIFHSHGSIWGNYMRCKCEWCYAAQDKRMGKEMADTWRAKMSALEIECENHYIGKYPFGTCGCNDCKTKNKV
jgi:hypothetical protein